MASAVIGLIGAGVSAWGQHQAGADAQQQAQQQAVLDQAEGRNAQQLALSQETTQRNQSREFLGRQAAAIGEAGVGYTGSSLGVMKQSAINAELDALNVRYHGAMTKFGFDYNAQSGIDTANARATGSNLLAAGTLLRGASNYYKQSNGLQ